jgi:hypothetical protein
MKPIATWSAIELADAIRGADGTIPSLEEVARLRGLLQDIVDICNTDPITWRHSPLSEDYEQVLSKIDDIAHGYFNE